MISVYALTEMDVQEELPVKSSQLKMFPLQVPVTVSCCEEREIKQLQFCNLNSWVLWFGLFFFFFSLLVGGNGGAVL